MLHKKKIYGQRVNLRTQINHNTGEIIKTMVNNDTMKPEGKELTYIPGLPIKENTYDSKTGKQISQKEVSSEEIDVKNFENARKVLNRQLMYLEMILAFNDALFFALLTDLMR